jgi:hypothetical protein
MNVEGLSVEFKEILIFSESIFGKYSSGVKQLVIEKTRKM